MRSQLYYYKYVYMELHGCYVIVVSKWKTFIPGIYLLNNIIDIKSRIRRWQGKEEQIIG